MYTIFEDRLSVIAVGSISKDHRENDVSILNPVEYYALKKEARMSSEFLTFIYQCAKCHISLFFSNGAITSNGPGTPHYRGFSIAVTHPKR
jgi:hypothetical protein